MYYSLPMDLNTMTADENTAVIDMSNLNFPVSPEKQKRSALIFIRNTGISMELSFDNCSYEDKEEYLIMYMHDNINIHIPLLTTTWIEILSEHRDNRIILPSILNSEEIATFIQRNQEFINEVNHLIISLPMYAIMVLSKMERGDDDLEIDMDGIEVTDYNGVNIYNLEDMSTYDDFGLLVFRTTDMIPRIYSQYFGEDSDRMPIDKITRRLPVFGMLDLMVAPQDIQDDFLNKIKMQITEREEEVDA